jgi:hypothetical protein
VRAAAQLDDARGVVDRRIGRRAARLEQQDGRAGVDEPPGDDRAARARADDDDLRGRTHRGAP